MFNKTGKIHLSSAYSIEKDFITGLSQAKNFEMLKK